MAHPLIERIAQALARDPDATNEALGAAAGCSAEVARRIRSSDLAQAYASHLSAPPAPAAP